MSSHVLAGLAVVQDWQSSTFSMRALLPARHRQARLCRLQLAKGPTGQAATPQCGACAPGVADANPADYNASMSGLA